MIIATKSLIPAALAALLAGVLPAAAQDRIGAPNTNDGWRKFSEATARESR